MTSRSDRILYPDDLPIGSQRTTEAGVTVRREPTQIPTYEPAPADVNPMFLERRVYQGSSGKVYPLPFVDRIAEAPSPHTWDAYYVSNGLIEVMLLPEIGGRIHAARDLTNRFDFVYRQHVIKPALVGLAGPWCSGGIEFNWPQHHRPSTYMPTEVAVEHGDDGSITVWMSEHEPMNRMKGMHGVCLHPGRSVIELKVRLYNRTPYTQSFLWWANAAIRVHEGYKSFLPPDVHFVADHAKRAISRYPLCDGRYYGVDYAARARDGVPEPDRPHHFVPAHSGGIGPSYAPNDLSWYANIPVPTSYMCLGSRHEFLGGYDFFAEAGTIHVADRRISPGKKQWTWGNHEFGYAWDRHLTDSDGPYIELMAGVFTDNQPDFAWLAPGETKTFSQFWYPYRAIGPVQAACVEGAISVAGNRIGVAVTRAIHGVVDAGTAGCWEVELAPDKPFMCEVAAGTPVGIVRLLENNAELLRFEPEPLDEAPAPAAAAEPHDPREIESADELYVTGLHLEQYRHATRAPEPYWQEALRRDPGDQRCNLALGRRALQRGLFEDAKAHLMTAIARATTRNPNPESGEAHYCLGLALRFLGQDAAAGEAFGKATWNRAWEAPAFQALGELACRRGDWTAAAGHLERAVQHDSDNLRARCLLSMVQGRLGRNGSVAAALDLDPLDAWARHLAGEPVYAGNDVRIDIVIDLMRAGLHEDALEVLAAADSNARDGTVPMLAYYEAANLTALGRDPATALAKAKASDPTYCFPSRLEDIAVLGAAPHDDARAAFFLGNLLYDRRRYAEAIAAWEHAAALEPTNSVVHRNLGIAAFNVLHDTDRARAAYDAAIQAAPNDARLWYERDQLWKRTGVAPEVRLAALRASPELVARRDDLTLELCALLNAVGRPDVAAELLASRNFQPWEGGEGTALMAFAQAHLLLAERALACGDPATALKHAAVVLDPPPNLGEARHLLANASDAWLAMGDAEAALGRGNEASRWWRRAAEFTGDFQEMSVRTVSELTYFQAVALNRLGRADAARARFEEIDAYARDLEGRTAKVDYFATSLPAMLLFEDDLQARQDNTARFLRAQAAAGLGELVEARKLLEHVLRVDPNHARAQALRASLTEPIRS